MGRFLKAAVSVLLLCLLVYFVGPTSVVRNLKQAPLWEFFGGGLPVQVLILVLMGATWHRLVSRCGEVTLGASVVGNLTVMFYGTLLPGRFSALLFAPMVFTSLSEDVSTEEAVGCTYTHMVGYLSVYGVGASVGLWVLFSNLDKWLLFLLLPVGAYLGGGLVLGVLPLIPNEKIKTVWSWIPGGETLRQHPRVAELLSTLETQRNRLRSWIKEPSLIQELTLLFALAVIVLPGLRAYLLFRGMDLHIPLVHLMVVLPAMYSVTILPFSIGGLGLAEGSAIGLLVLLGYPPETVAVVIFLDRLLAVYLPGFLGWVVFSWSGLRNRTLAPGRSAPD